jgi:hypothetical protein
VAECTTGKEKRNRLLYLVQTQDFFLFWMFKAKWLYKLR